MGPALAGPISDRKWGRPSAGPILLSSLIGRTIGRSLPDMVVSRETWRELKGLDYSEIFTNGKVTPRERAAYAVDDFLLFNSRPRVKKKQE